MRDDFLVFGSPLIEQAEIDEVVDCMRSAWIGTGPRSRQFEADFAAYKGVPYAAGLNSCTAGLHLSCQALDLRPGDEVITTALTFCATINAIIHSGATPVLADVDAASLNIDPAAIRAAITPRTKAILIVHFAGRSCAMDEIMSIARENSLAVIEDCAHAIETEYKGGKAGTFGDFGVFSFYPTKNVVTGEGGMVISRDEERIDRIRVLGLHGLSRHAWQRYSDAGYKHYLVEEVGYKYNMTDMQAAMGIHQLARVEKNWLKRQAVWERYMAELSGLPIGLPAAIEPEARHALHLFQITVEESSAGISRDSFLEEMTKRNIGVGVHYLAIPEHPVYQRMYGWRPEDWPTAYEYGRKTVSLPLSAKLTEADVSDVIEAVIGIIGRT